MLRILPRTEVLFVLGTSLIMFSWILIMPINSFVDGNAHVGSIYCGSTSLLHNECDIIYEPGTNLEKTKLPDQLLSLESVQAEISSSSEREISIFGNIRDTIMSPLDQTYTSGLFYAFFGLFTHLGFEISILTIKLLNVSLIFIPYFLILKCVTRDRRNFVNSIYIIHFLLQPILNFWVLNSLHPTSWLLIYLPPIVTILLLLNSSSNFISSRKNYSQLKVLLLCLLVLSFATRRDSGLVIVFTVISVVFFFFTRDSLSIVRINWRSLSVFALVITVCLTLIYLSVTKLSIYTRSVPDQEVLFHRLVLLWNSKTDYLLGVFGGDVNGENRSYILNYALRLNDTFVEVNLVLFLLLFLLTAIFAKNTRETVFFCLAPYLILLPAYIYKLFTWNIFNIQYHQYAPYAQVCIALVAVSVVRSNIFPIFHIIFIACIALTVYMQSLMLFFAINVEFEKIVQREIKFDYSTGEILFSWMDNSLLTLILITFLTLGYAILFFSLLQIIKRNRIDREMI